MRGVLLVALASTACIASEPDIVRARAASMLHCKPAAVTVRELGAADDGTRYAVSACGQEAVFHCSRQDMDNIGQSGKPMPSTPATVCEPAGPVGTKDPEGQTNPQP